MNIRRAENKDMNGINKLLHQVLMVHHNGRPDIFKPNAKKYTDTELTDILDYLLPEGPVFRQDHRWWFEVVSKSDEGCVDLPMVTIVNADSYSAAELLAAELREFGGAPVVGVQTSGKGYSQLTFPLLNGGAMGLSTAKYFTGEGVSLIGTGIVPDVVVERTGDTDTQLQAALDLLK